jgi:FTR1 family protein
MFESFVIMLREGIEAALIIGLILVVLKRTGNRRLERPVYWGLGWAILASIGAAIGLNRLPIDEEAYEGILYWVSAAFVTSMLWWMHHHAATLRAQIEQRVGQAVVATSVRWDPKEAWALGAFTFLMVFREGAESVMFLSAVRLTTEALLSFMGTLAGLAAAVVFCVMFVRGSLHVNLRRFFLVTEWVLGLFIVQLVVNGYHEFSEAGLLPATQRSMAVIGPLVRHNSLFILAIVAIPLLIWLTGTKRPQPAPCLPAGRPASLGAAERRLAVARAQRERWSGVGAVAMTVIVLAAVGVAYAREVAPKHLPPPEMLQLDGEAASVPLSAVADGTLHRFGVVVGDRTVRFLALKSADGRVRVALDACKICGAFGYAQGQHQLICLNCAATINPATLGVGGGCNPIPLESELTSTAIRVHPAALRQDAHLFAVADQVAQTAIDPVCGMRVKISEAAAFETVNGQTTYFCSERCHLRFLQGG